MAARQGLTLQKCPRRDPLAAGYGTYRLKWAVPDDDPHFVDVWYGLTLDQIQRRETVAEWHAHSQKLPSVYYGLTLDQIEAELLRLPTYDVPPWI
jgi:hypothetical protein